MQDLPDDIAIVERRLAILSLLYDKVLLEDPQSITRRFPKLAGPILALSEAGIMQPCNLGMDPNAPLIPWRMSELNSTARKLAEVALYPYAKSRDVFKSWVAMENAAIMLTHEEMMTFCRTHGDNAARVAWALHRAIPGGKEWAEAGGLDRSYSLERAAFRLKFTNKWMLLSANLRARAVLGPWRSPPLIIKATAADPDPSALGVFERFLSIRRLRAPRLVPSLILSLRDSSGGLALRHCSREATAEKPEDRPEWLANDYDNSLRAVENSIRDRVQASSVLLGGSLATLGGLLGGPLGAALGGFGSAGATAAFERLLRRHYEKAKQVWPFIFAA